MRAIPRGLDPHGTGCPGPLDERRPAEPRYRESVDERPSPGVLWYQAEGDPERYRELMLEHGLLLRPGDEGYEDASRNLPCGWPHRPETRRNPDT